VPVQAAPRLALRKGHGGAELHLLRVRARARVRVRAGARARARFGARVRDRV